MNSIYVGYDPREAEAYQACLASLRRHTRHQLATAPINMRLLGDRYKRLTTKRAGILYDEVSGAPMATEFSLARFFIPAVQPIGWALYCDCDFLWRAPVEQLFALADSRFAVQVVKHAYFPSERTKMDGQVQTAYARKNWSSLMLLNCGAITRLFPDGEWLAYANSARGLALHQFAWLPDEAIGTLPPEWNWLEGSGPATPEPKAVHFTRGIPSMPGYENVPYAEEWRGYAHRTASA